MLKPKNDIYVLSLSFGNYLKGDGGVDKVIAEHKRIFSDINVSYIQIAPIGKSKTNNEICFYTIVVDGKFYKTMSEYEVFSYLNFLENEKVYLDSIFIHHLLKFNIKFIYKLLNSNDAPINFYLHDYYSVCKQLNLLKNKEMFCGEQKPSNKKCRDCCFYSGIEMHLRDMDDFFETYHNRLLIVSPSQVALDIWKISYGHHKLNSMVVAHQSLIGEEYLKQSLKKELNVAYIGRMIPSKGSNLWKNFAESNSENSIRKYYLGISENNFSNVKKIPVYVTSNNLDAMINALKENDIDIVILWSIWPETYSYVYFEALAAKCYVITSNCSGNIAAMVKKNKNGKVFNTENEALEFLSDHKKLSCEFNRFKENAKAFPMELKPNIKITKLLSKNKFSVKIKNNIYKKYLLSLPNIAVNFLYKKRYK